jgi:hypothetical protein
MSATRPANRAAAPIRHQRGPIDPFRYSLSKSLCLLAPVPALIQTFPRQFEPARRTTGKGHEEQLPPLWLNVRCVIRQGTFAGTFGNARDAPIPAIRGTAIEPPESTQRGQSLQARSAPRARSANRLRRLSFQIGRRVAIPRVIDGGFDGPIGCPLRRIGRICASMDTAPKRRLHSVLARDQAITTVRATKRSVARTDPAASLQAAENS